METGRITAVLPGATGGVEREDVAEGAAEVVDPVEVVTGVVLPETMGSTKRKGLTRRTQALRPQVLVETVQ